MGINDFGISFSTVNGSGSATANNTILRAIHKMGIPVAARNIFPSNIQGMPTWYYLRVNRQGFLGRLEHDDIQIAMNPDTVHSDLKRLKPEGLLLIDEQIEGKDIPKNIEKYCMPVDRILKECNAPLKLTIYLANMVYVGVLASLIGIRIENISDALNYHFNHQKNAVEPNFRVVQAAFQWSEENISKTENLKLEPIQANNQKIMIDGNTAAALGALYGGLQYSAWYPITPATSLAESLNEFIPQLRIDPETGTTTCVVVQAEDEMAAIGMVVGAGWAGLRAMTSTSGPGLCLMAETLGLAYFAEVPIVVWDIQRVGPSTGLPTHTSQGDLSFSYFISHGDKDFVILLPGDVSECFEFGWRALDIAEELQTPVIVLSDLELGMNIWVTKNLQYPDEGIKRGKILWEKDLEKKVSIGKKKWGRYLDLDHDGIPYRTVAGNLHEGAAYFTRGTGHDEFAHYSEDDQDWEKTILRLKKKFEKAKKLIPPPEVCVQDSNAFGFLTYGSTYMPVLESICILKEKGIDLDCLRIKALPFTDVVKEYLENHQRVFVVEANRDGQMKDILTINFPNYADRFVSIARCNGLSLSAEWIISQFEKFIKLEIGE